MKPYSAVISGTGLYTPENVITNEELVASYNGWASQYNAEHSVEFIIKASGIRQRFAYVKEGILDTGRMRPLIPERPEESLSNQAEMSLHAVRDTIKAAGKSVKDIDAVVVSCAYTQRSYPAVAIEVQNELGIDGFAFDMLVAFSAATFALYRAYEMVIAGTNGIEQHDCLRVCKEKQDA